MTEKVSENKVQYAGFWIRLAAFTIDFLVLIGISIIVAIFFALYAKNAGVEKKTAETISATAGFLINWVYYVFMTAKFGATVGKKFFGIRVVTKNGKFLDLGLVIIREVAGKFISATFFGLGYLWISLDKKKQGLHDKLSSTVVVVENSRRGATWKVLLTAVPFLVFIVFSSWWVLLGVSKEALSKERSLGEAIQGVSEKIVPAALCLSEGNELILPNDKEKGGGDLCSDPIGHEWPALSGGYSYGEISGDAISIEFEGEVAFECEIDGECQFFETEK